MIPVLRLEHAIFPRVGGTWRCLRPVRRILAGLLFGLVFAGMPVRAQERLALIIGIDDYREVPKLRKAGADARAVAELAGRAGFRVDLVIDPDRRGLNRALAEFLGKITPGAIVFFHFSGHGVEIEGNSYLLPADIPKPRAGDQEFVKREALRLSELFESFRTAQAATRIFIIDACRDNPFAATGVRSVGGSRGLAALSAPKGSFVIYSASSSQTALDRLGDNDVEPTAVFTRVFLRHAATPGRSIVDVARGLRDEVERLAKSVGHEQRPAYYDELTGDFALMGTPGTAPPPLTPPPPVAAAPPPIGQPVPRQPDPSAECKVRYWRARQTGTCAAFDEVARQCAATPEGQFAQQIVQRECAPPRLPARGQAIYSVPADSPDGYLNLREGPGVSFAALARIPAGETGLLLRRCVPAASGVGRPWCAVTWRGLSGFVSSCCIVNAGTGAPPPLPRGASTTAVPTGGTFAVMPNVSEGYLNMRAGPGPGHPVLTRVPAGAGGVTVLSCRPPDSGGGSNPWCAVRWRDFAGWLSSCCIVDANGARPR
jgi:uncharacterized protein YraI